jgi:hypothetical protein
MQIEVTAEATATFASPRQTEHSGKNGSTGQFPVRRTSHNRDRNSLILDDIPYFFKRCAVTHELFSLIVELRPSTTSMGLAENIKRMSEDFAHQKQLLTNLKELHLLKYKQTMLEYLQHFQRRRVSPLKPLILKEFSSPHDADGYADGCITDDLITDLYLEFSERTRKEESSNYLRTLTGRLCNYWMPTKLNICSAQLNACLSTTHSIRQEKPQLWIRIRPGATL